MSGVDCPPWCTTAHRHHIHEGLLFESPGFAAVTVDSSEIRPIELNVWDETGTGNGARLGVQLGAEQARTLARVLGRVGSWEDVAAFTAALAKGAEIVQDATAHPTDDDMAAAVAEFSLEEGQ